MIFLLNCVSLIDIFLSFKFFTVWLLIFWVFLLIWWIGLIFNRKRKKNNSTVNEENNKNYYEVDCCCQNCDLNEKVKIPKGIKITDIICPECGITQQLKKKKECEENN